MNDHPLPAPLTLRAAAPHDVPTLLRFTHALAAHEGRPEIVRATEAGLHGALFGPTPLARAMLAKRDGTTLGAAVWSYPFRMYQARPVLHVSIVYVDVSARGEGVGRRMFADLARRALRENCVGVEWGVKNDNHTAIAFYRSLGADTQSGGSRMKLEGEALAAIAGLP